ncbi:hypothetical protein C0991_000352 [Blastosporella zonata]|nr:hypothetical protein C0991_000352 [Blastosporella zonata]
MAETDITSPKVSDTLQVIETATSEPKQADEQVTAASAAVITEPPSAPQSTSVPAKEPSSTLTASPAESGASPTVAVLAPSAAAVLEPAPASAPVEPIEITRSTATPVTSETSTSASNNNTVLTAVAPGTTAETSEPQNPLTERFTDQEWTALKQFRDDLPEIFAEGFPDDPKANEKPITFWGVNIDPRDSLDARVSVVLMKFLRARQGHSEDTLFPCYLRPCF